MKEFNFTVTDENGIHARPASMVVRMCNQYKEQEIHFIGNGRDTNPKNIISVLSAGLSKGTEIEVQVIGENEETVCNEIVAFIESLTD